MNAETEAKLLVLSNKVLGFARLFKGFTDEVVLGSFAAYGIGAMLEEISDELIDIANDTSEKPNTIEGN